MTTLRRFTELCKIRHLAFGNVTAQIFLAAITAGVGYGQVVTATSCNLPVLTPVPIIGSTPTPIGTPITLVGTPIIAGPITAGPVIAGPVIAGPVNVTSAPPGPVACTAIAASITPIANGTTATEAGTMVLVTVPQNTPPASQAAVTSVQTFPAGSPAPAIPASSLGFLIAEPAGVPAATAIADGVSLASSPILNGGVTAPQSLLALVGSTPPQTTSAPQITNVVPGSATLTITGSGFGTAAPPSILLFIPTTCFVDYGCPVGYESPWIALIMAQTVVCWSDTSIVLNLLGAAVPGSYGVTITNNSDKLSGFYCSNPGCSPS